MENIMHTAQHFKDLSSLYQYLDHNAIEHKHASNISTLFRDVRDIMYKAGHKIEAEKAQWETDVFNFIIKNNKLSPLFIGTNDEGKTVEYPTLERFTDKTYDYLTVRLKSTHNPLTKSQYAHLLWLSPRKHTKFAQIAVDSYLELIKIYEEKEKADPTNHFGMYLTEIIKNVALLALQLNYKIKVIKSELIRILLEIDYSYPSSFRLCADIIKLMLETRKKFPQKDFEGLENVCWKIADIESNKKEFFSAIEMYELGERVDERLGKKSHEWKKQIAISHETLMEMAGSNLGAINHCQHAMVNYKLIGDVQKIEELEKKYSELKGKLELTKYKKDLDITEIINKSKAIAEKISQRDTDEIITILMHDNDLLPKYKNMEDEALRFMKEFPLQGIVSVDPIDQSGNTPEHFTEEDERKYFRILEQFDFALRYEKIYLINEIFILGIKIEKLSTEVFLNFLHKNSWYGKTITKTTLNGDKFQYNWLNLLAPALNDYFNEMRWYLFEQSHYPNLVLSIDSLTLKLEGLLRDFAQVCDVTTFYQKKDDKGRPITIEKDVHRLLFEEKIKNKFTDDDLLFFRFLLVEKSGFNLRHKIAHSLMHFNEYAIEFMHLLILALLRLGKYDFK